MTRSVAVRVGKRDRHHLPERPGGSFAQMVPVPFSWPAGSFNGLPSRAGRLGFGVLGKELAGLGRACRGRATFLKGSSVSRAAWRIFVARFQREAGRASNSVISGVFGIAFRGSVVRTSGCRGLVFEVVAPFFSLRRHPNTFLRESVCLCGNRPGRSGGLSSEFRSTRHGIFSATVSHARAVSIRLTLGNQGRVQVAHQTGYGRRGPLPRREGPMQPSFALRLLLPCSILVLSGEAELGSAGTQPNKE